MKKGLHTSEAICCAKLCGGKLSYKVVKTKNGRNYASEYYQHFAKHFPRRLRALSLARKQSLIATSLPVSCEDEISLVKVDIESRRPKQEPTQLHI